MSASLRQRAGKRRKLKAKVEGLSLSLSLSRWLVGMLAVRAIDARRGKQGPCLGHAPVACYCVAGVTGRLALVACAVFRTCGIRLEPVGRSGKSAGPRCSQSENLSLHCLHFASLSLRKTRDGVLAALTGALRHFYPNTLNPKSEIPNPKSQNPKP